MGLNKILPRDFTFKYRGKKTTTKTTTNKKMAPGELTPRANKLLYLFEK